MDARKFIPKHKDDQSVIEKLKALSFEELKPIVPDLLEWLQDINWPISGPVADVLKPFIDEIASEIMNIFQTNDGLWKLWTLVLLVKETNNPILLNEIERIAKFPTRDEIEEEANLEAIAILNGEYRLTIVGQEAPRVNPYYFNNQ